MTGNADLVAVGVAEVGAVVVWVVMRSQPRWTFARTSMPQSGLVALSDRRAVPGHEGNHLAVARIMRLTVVGLANDEKRARPPGAMPDRKSTRLNSSHT